MVSDAFQIRNQLLVAAHVCPTLLNISERVAGDYKQAACVSPWVLFWQRYDKDNDTFYSSLLEYKLWDLGEKYEVYQGYQGSMIFNCEHISLQTLKSVDNILYYEGIALIRYCTLQLIESCRYWILHKFGNLKLCIFRPSCIGLQTFICKHCNTHLCTISYLFALKRCIRGRTQL